MSVPPSAMEGLVLQFVGTPIQGPAGPQGIKGEQGARGEIGPNGTNGERGPQGIQGYAGPKGDKGDAGIQGLQGAIGPEGLPGAKGDKGDKGDTGAAGTPGAAGSQGIQGIQGVAGLQGPKGDTGDAGAQGIQGVKGDKGDTGNTGSQGIQGPAGPKGDAGTGLNNRDDWAAGTYQPGDYVFATGSSAATSMWILKGTVPYVSSVEPKDDLSHWIEFEAPAGQDGADGQEVELQATGTHIQWRLGTGSWTSLVALASLKGDTGAKGDTGPQGAAGSGTSWLTGSGAPSGGSGNNGDWYRNTNNGEVYGPKTSGSWGSVVGVILPKSITAENQAGTETNKLVSPAGVREYTQQFGLSANYSNSISDLNTAVVGQTFGWSNTSTNTPVASSYGRGIVIPGSSGNVTQLGFVNASAKLYIRFCASSTWGAWSEIAGGAAAFVASSRVLGRKTSGAGAGEELTLSDVLDFVGSAAQGDILYRGASTWTRLGAGSSGQVLTSGGASANPSWTTPSGGGGGGPTYVTSTTNKVIQQLTPVTLVSASISSGKVYKFRFDGILNEAASSNLKFGLMDIAKQSLAARVTFRDNTGLVVKDITAGASDGSAGVTFGYGAISGDGNLVTIEGTFSCSSNSTLAIYACNAVNQWDYRQFSPGCNLRLEEVGTWSA